MKITEITKPERPVRFIQFGGGVFLRGFFERMLQHANDKQIIDGSVMIVRTHSSGEDPLAAQNFMYTHVARDGDHSEITKIDCVAGSVHATEEHEKFLSLADISTAEVIVSNTTESGIAYPPCSFDAPAGYPALLTKLLHRRFVSGLGGMLVLPCELIENNGGTLRALVLRYADEWKLDAAFADFVEKDCSFRNTLVDSIVSGKPGDDFDVKLDYEDTLVNTSEYFHLFIIEGSEDPRLPFLASGANIKWVDDLEAYRTLKVRILNGAHTSMIPYALLLGVETVGDCMKDSRTSAHLSACLEEILLSLDFDKDEAKAYADEVLRRFANPYIRHLCRNIALNSLDKFRVRVLPSILAYKEKTGKLPTQLSFAFKMLLTLYRDGEPNDTPEKIACIRTRSLDEILADTALWGCDLRFLTEVIA